MTYWQSALLFCGLFDFFALWLASRVSPATGELRFDDPDTLRDGSRLASLIAHLPLIIHAKHFRFTFTDNVLTKRPIF